MYVPDKIRIVITKRYMAEVYSADAGHENEPPAKRVDVGYDYDKVTFEVQE